MPARACPVCGAQEALPRFEVEGVASPIVACPTCGLGRFEPPLAGDEVARFYPEEYYGQLGTKFQPAVERMVRWVGSRHIAYLSRGVPPGGRTMDVGCGRGVILGSLADRGFEVHGVERTAAAAAGADPRASIRIAPRLADAGYPERHFDEVVIWHVLEHLADPLETLVEVHRILRPGGRLVVAVPNFASAQARWSGPDWFHLDAPRHLFHFSLEALCRLLLEVGFTVESEHHFSLRQNPFGWIQSALNRFTGLPRNGLYTLLHDRPHGAPAPFDPATRFQLRMWFALGLVPALLTTLVETVLRNGATVHVSARRAAASDPPARPV
ncbi:MAG: methyltransferase domain-containing protein [Myxococcota bacterium]